MKFELEKLLSPPFDDGELFKNLKLIKEEFLKTNNKKSKENCHTWRINNISP